MTIGLIHEAENSKIDGVIWVFSESYDAQLDGIQPKFEYYMKPSQIVGQPALAKKGVWGRVRYKNKRGKYIDFAFKTYEQGRAKVQSAKLIAAGFDEEPPEDIFDEVYTRCIDLKAPIYLAFTPLKGMTWSYEGIWKASESDKSIKVYNWGMASNPFIPRHEIEMCKRRWSAKKCRMRLYGLYTGSEDAVFDTFDREKHLKDGLYNPNDPVYVSVDWGVRYTSIIWAQKAKIVRADGTIKETIKEIDCTELYGAGYGHVMMNILSKDYDYAGYYCDPAGSARSQSTKSGVSLLIKIKEDYGIEFEYLKRLGIEESIEMVSSLFENGAGEVGYTIDKSIQWADPDGKVIRPADRIEGYVRDPKTQLPIKDGINDHNNDCRRYLVANLLRRNAGGFKQH